MNDFYLDELSRAAYFEKDWFDHVVTSGGARPGRFAFAPFDLVELHSSFHQRFVEVIKGAWHGDSPARVLEIGSSAGRTFHEVTKAWPGLRHATLVEPSAHLRDLFSGIYDGQRHHFPVLKGNGEVVEVRMDTSAIRAAAASVDVRVLGLPFAELADDLGVFDLVICANVIDQCDWPLRLVELLRRSTRPGGMIALSCTYQWQSKYRGLPTDPIRHLDQLFPEPSALVAEANIPFRVRVNERHWMTFLSHVCVFKAGEI